MDKGAGMIRGPPFSNDSGALGIVLTDAHISPESLQSALTYAVGRNFNSTSVDGCRQTIQSLRSRTELGYSGVPEIDEEADR